MAARSYKVPILLPADPIALLEAATKQYVDFSAIPIFATTAARDSAWVSPPNGAFCVTTDTGVMWQRISGTWYPRPGRAMAAHGYPTTTTNIFTATWTQIPIAALGTGTTLITLSGNGLRCPYAGFYRANGAVSLNAQTGGNIRRADIKTSGGMSIGQSSSPPVLGGHTNIITVNTPAIVMSAGEIVTLHCYQDSGATMVAQIPGASEYQSYLSLEYIGASV